MAENVLEVKDLQTAFKLLGGKVIHPVDGVSISIKKGDVIGLVGESGCGKSMTALSIIGLVPSPGKISKGSVCFEGKDLVQMRKEELWQIRGGKIATIFQDPMTYLNPVQTVGNQIAEAVLLHEKVSKKEAKQIAVDMLREVGIPGPERVAKSYPFELSGGMRQRVLIAMAICCKPDLLIADEPTTALDVTVQAQILALLKRLVQQNGISMLMITHDMGIVADTCNKIYVMYAGQVVESGTADDIYYKPRHPYTRALLQSVLTVVERKERVNTIPGFVPDFSNMPMGCRFADRCDYACEDCRQQEQQLQHVDGIHFARCMKCNSFAGGEQNG